MNSYANLAIQKNKDDTLIWGIKIKEIEDQWFLFRDDLRDLNHYAFLKNNQSAAAFVCPQVAKVANFVWQSVKI